MNLQPKSVTGAVEKTNVLPVSNFGRIPTFLEQRLDRLVDLHSIHARLDLAQGELLPFLYCFPKFPLRVTRATTHDRPRHVAPITGLRVSWKNIEDNQ